MLNQKGFVQSNTAALTNGTEAGSLDERRGLSIPSTLLPATHHDRFLIRGWHFGKAFLVESHLRNLTQFHEPPQVEVLNFTLELDSKKLLHRFQGTAVADLIDYQFRIDVLILHLHRCHPPCRVYLNKTGDSVKHAVFLEAAREISSAERPNEPAFHGFAFNPKNISSATSSGDLLVGSRASS